MTSAGLSPAAKSFTDERPQGLKPRQKKEGFTAALKRCATQKLFGCATQNRELTFDLSNPILPQRARKDGAASLASGSGVSFHAHTEALRHPKFDTQKSATQNPPPKIRHPQFDTQDSIPDTNRRPIVTRSWNPTLKRGKGRRALGWGTLAHLFNKNRCLFTRREASVVT